MSLQPEALPIYVPESSPPPSQAHPGPRLASASEVYASVRDLTVAPQEHFLCFDLNIRHRVIARRTVGIGSICGVEAHPREVFRQAIVNGAAAVILVHNHPSGDPSPSRQDIELTTRLRDVGDLVGIAVLDHVIVAAEGWTSLAERGWK